MWDFFQGSLFLFTYSTVHILYDQLLTDVLFFLRFETIFHLKHLNRMFYMIHLHYSYAGVINLQRHVRGNILAREGPKLASLKPTKTPVLVDDAVMSPARL